MALNVGELNAVLTADAGGYMRVLRDAERAANKFERSINSVSKSLENAFGPAVMNLSGKVAMALTAAAAAAAAFAGASVKMAADMRSNQKAFDILIGDTEKSKKFLEDLVKFAEETPFEFPGLVSASRKLLAFGFALEDILPIMGVVGDAAASLNLGQEGMNRLIIAFGQIRAKAKLSAEEMMQITETGIPAWEFLAKKIGVSIPEAMKMAERGMIDSFTAINAILFGMQDKFKGGMDVLSKEINGILLNIKDKIGAIMRAIGEDIIKAFDIQGKLEYVFGYLSAFAEYVKTSGVSEALKNLVPKELMISLFALAGVLTALLIPAILAWAAALIEAAITAAPLLLAGAAIGAIAWAIWQAWEPLGQLFQGLWEYILAVFDETWAVLTKFANSAYETFKPIIDAVSSLANAFGEAWDWIVNKVAESWNNMLSMISSGVQKAISLVSSLKTAFGGAPIGTQILGVNNEYDIRKSNALLKITGAISGIGAKLSEGANGLANVVRQPFQIPPFKGISGGGGGGGFAGGGGGGASKYDNQLEKMVQLVANLNTKIMGETGTTLEKGAARLAAEVSKMQDDINDAMAAGVDAKAAQDALDEYNKVVKANLEKTWREAWQNLKDQSGLTHAQLVGDAQAEADAELQITLTKLAKERDEKLKQVQRDGNDAEARLAVEQDYLNKVALAEKQNLEKHRQNQLQIYQWQVQLNNNLLAMHQQTAAQTDAANLAVYDSQITYLQGQLVAVKQFSKEYYDIMNQIATVTQQKNDVMAKNLTTSWDLAIEEIKNQQFNYKDLMVNTWNDISSAVSGHFKNMITGAESMSQGIKGIIRDLSTSILEMFAEIMVQQYIMQPIRNWFTGLLGGFGGGGGGRTGGNYGNGRNAFASGGLASGWSLVGEKGPELAYFGRPTQIYPADETERMLSGGRSQPITVNLNVTGVRDANSFMQSQGQIGAAAAKSINRAMRRNL